MYNIPILRQKIEDADCSGVYIFKHISGKLAVGSALSCRDRLQDHLNSFYGHRPKTFLHEWVINNGGIESVKWAPMLTYDNITQKWYNNNYDSPLSLGGTRILLAFGIYMARLLEQCIYSYNKPYLSKYSEDRYIIYFNFTFNSEDLSIDQNYVNVYQAWRDKKKTKLLAESNSLNSLANMLGFTVGTVRNNMNWKKCTRIIDKDSGKKITVYIIEKGGNFRNQVLNSQLGPKHLYSEVKLLKRSLYDLMPGRLYAIDVNTLEDFGNYANQRELWTCLNPNSLGEFNQLETLAKQRSYLDNRISIYIGRADTLAIYISTARRILA